MTGTLHAEEKKIRNRKIHKLLIIQEKWICSKLNCYVCIFTNSIKIPMNISNYKLFSSNSMKRQTSQSLIKQLFPLKLKIFSFENIKVTFFIQPKLEISKLSKFEFEFNRYTGTHILVYNGRQSRTSRYYYIYIVVMEMISVIINTCLIQNKGVSWFG